MIKMQGGVFGAIANSEAAVLANRRQKLTPEVRVARSGRFPINVPRTAGSAD